MNETASNTSTDTADLVERARRTGGARPVVLVDGRSGTGKTTLGNTLAPLLGAQLVHLDDVYPGWDGLRSAADAVAADMLAPPDPTGRPRWRRWDWGTSLSPPARPARRWRVDQESAAWAQAEWHAIDATLPLVVEGCGALSRASAPLATLRIWMEGDDAERRRRAIARDGDTFARQWDRWAAQEDAFIAAESPRSLADVVLRT